MDSRFGPGFGAPWMRGFGLLTPRVWGMGFGVLGAFGAPCIGGLGDPGFGAPDRT